MKITSINVRVDDDTKARVAAIAQYREITISELVREWLSECLPKEEKIVEQVKKELGEQ